jgi:saccharopine dehydrogenase-like NADP-dependent oxidoreductase
VAAAGKHLALAGASAVVLAATGPVGQRAVRLLALEGASVRVVSRRLERAQAVCDDVGRRLPAAKLVATPASSEEETIEVLSDASVVIACGAAGVELASKDALARASSLKVAIDLNAVPPAGLNGIEVMDRGVERNGVICYGAVGVGGVKMKIHKEALRRLFEANDQVLDAEEIYAIAKRMMSDEG